MYFLTLLNLECINIMPKMVALILMFKLKQDVIRCYFPSSIFYRNFIVNLHHLLKELKFSSFMYFSLLLFFLTFLKSTYYVLNIFNIQHA